MAKRTKSTPAIPKPPGIRIADQVIFKYIFPESYNPQYSNGAHGGVTTQGEIVMNFFMERQPLPHQETFAVKPTGIVGEAKSRTPPDPDGSLTVLRYIVGGIILNRDAAVRLHDFLGTTIKQLDAIAVARNAALNAAASSAATEKKPAPKN